MQWTVMDVLVWNPVGYQIPLIANLKRSAF